MKNPVKLTLVGIDGNAYSIMGHWQRAARKAGWTQPEIDEVLNEARSSDYDHLLITIIENSVDPGEDE